MLADITLSTETTVVVGALLSALVVAIGVLYRAFTVELLSERDSWRGMAKDAIEKYEQAIAAGKIKSVRQKVPDLAPVVGEHSSPLTKKQIESADMATWRARLTAAAHQAGEPARE